MPDKTRISPLDNREHRVKVAQRGSLWEPRCLCGRGAETPTRDRAYAWASDHLTRMYPWVSGN